MVCWGCTMKGSCPPECSVKAKARHRIYGELCNAPNNPEAYGIMLAGPTPKYEVHTMLASGLAEDRIVAVDSNPTAGTVLRNLQKQFPHLHVENEDLAQVVLKYPHLRFVHADFMGHAKWNLVTAALIADRLIDGGMLAMTWVSNHLFDKYIRDIGTNGSRADAWDKLVRTVAGYASVELELVDQFTYQRPRHMEMGVGIWRRVGTYV